MPCYEVNLVSVEFKAENKDLLFKALDSLFINFNFNEKYKEVTFRNGYIDLKNNEITCESTSFANSIKRAYSLKAIESIAKQKRWIMKNNGNRIQLKRI